MFLQVFRFCSRVFMGAIVVGRLWPFPLDDRACELWEGCRNSAHVPEVRVASFPQRECADIVAARQRCGRYKRVCPYFAMLQALDGEAHRQCLRTDYGSGIYSHLHYSLK